MSLRKDIGSSLYGTELQRNNKKFILWNDIEKSFGIINYTVYIIFYSILSVVFF